MLIDLYACYVVQDGICLLPYNTICYDVNKYISPILPFLVVSFALYSQTGVGSPPQISLLPGIKRYVSTTHNPTLMITIAYERATTPPKEDELKT